MWRVEREDRLGRAARFEPDQRSDVAGGRDLERLARARARADDPPRAGRRADRGDARDRPEYLDERGQGVGTDVEQRSGAVLEEERRVRVPRVRARRLHQGKRGERRPDRPLVDQPSHGLQSGPEEGVRSAADPDAGAVGRREEPSGVGEIGRQRLLVPDVLAGGDRALGDLGVGGRDREVDDDLDLGMADDDGGVAGDRDAMLGRLRSSHVGDGIADREDPRVRELREVLEVLRADVPGADDADPDGPGPRGVSHR